jgi:hypothetical protein
MIQQLLQRPSLNSPAYSCVSITVARLIVNANHGIVRAAAGTLCIRLRY